MHVVPVALFQAESVVVESKRCEEQERHAVNAYPDINASAKI